ncbi:MAG: DUF2237 domain-containing protein [Clostridia bacterium]|nr:DUF2237 domain-containing protein [Deltaproteobacteria bacterium]
MLIVGLVFVLTAPQAPRNVEGGDLTVCSIAPMTGWSRNGRCETASDDSGTHVVCAQVTRAFLEFSKTRGNDLIAPRGTFPGLKEGDRWCLCALRYREALEGGVAPPVVLDATHAKAVDYVPLEKLREHALHAPK